jgi:cell division protease FtsH
VIAGPEKKSRVMSEKERLITAYHELGHAIVGHLLPNSDPVHKVSIISRGQALGYTISLPREDRYLTTKATLMSQMAMTLGGRAAEELVFHEVTTGAANDIEKVTHTAKQMIMRFGMSEKLGPRVLGHNQGAPFLGRDMHSEPDYSDDIARDIDAEIRRIIDEAHQRARDILVEHRHDLDALSDVLLRRETIEREEFIRLLDGEAEAEVFRAKDAKAAQKLAEETPGPGKAPAPRRLPLPPATPGQPVPEA